MVPFQCQDVFFHVTMTTRRSAIMDDMRQIRTTVKQLEHSVTERGVCTYVYNTLLRLLLEIDIDATHIRSVLCDRLRTVLHPGRNCVLLTTS